MGKWLIYDLFKSAPKSWKQLDKVRRTYKTKVTKTIFFFIFYFLVFTPLELKIWILAGGRGKKKGNKKKKKKRRADDFGNGFSFRDELSDIFPFFIALLISWLTLEFPEVSNEFIIKSY